MPGKDDKTETALGEANAFSNHDKTETELKEANASSKQNKKRSLTEKLRDKRDELTGRMSIAQQLNKLSEESESKIKALNFQLRDIQQQQEQQRKNLQLRELPTQPLNKYTRVLSGKSVNDLTAAKIKNYQEGPSILLSADTLEQISSKLEKIKTFHTEIDPKISQLFAKIKEDFAAGFARFEVIREEDKAIHEGILVKIINIVIKLYESIDKTVAVLSGATQNPLEVFPVAERSRNEQISLHRESLKIELERQEAILSMQLKDLRAELGVYVKLLEKDIKRLEGRATQEKLETEEQAKAATQLVKDPIDMAPAAVQEEKQEPINQEEGESQVKKEQAQEKTEEEKEKDFTLNVTTLPVVEAEGEEVTAIPEASDNPQQSSALEKTEEEKEMGVALNPNIQEFVQKISAAAGVGVVEVKAKPNVNPGSENISPMESKPAAEVHEINLVEREKIPEEQLAQELEIHNQTLIFDEKAITSLPSREETGKLTNLLRWVTRRVSILKQEATDQVANLHRQYHPYTTDTSSLIAKEISEKTSPSQLLVETKSNSTTRALPEAQRNESNEANPAAPDELKHRKEEGTKPSSQVTEVRLTSIQEREGRQ